MRCHPSVYFDPDSLLLGFSIILDSRPQRANKAPYSRPTGLPGNREREEWMPLAGNTQHFLYETAFKKAGSPCRMFFN